jgi:hypothetical protein
VVVPGVAFEYFFTSVHESGTSYLSVTSISELLGLELQELAALAGVHLNTLRTHPENPRLQMALRDLVRVLSAAATAQPDIGRAFYVIKNKPIPAFDYKALLQLVQAGRTDDAVGYLESISSGFVG